MTAVELNEDEVAALRAAVDALLERDRNLPHGDGDWRLRRMVAATTARVSIENAYEKGIPVQVEITPRGARSIAAQFADAERDAGADQED